MTKTLHEDRLEYDDCPGCGQVKLVNECHTLEHCRRFLLKQRDALRAKVDELWKENIFLYENLDFVKARLELAQVAARRSDGIRAELKAAVEALGCTERDLEDTENQLDRANAIDEAVKKDADTLLRACLGKDLWNGMWGPPLEKAGQAVDKALTRAKAAEDEVERLKDRLETNEVFYGRRMVKCTERRNALESCLREYTVAVRNWIAGETGIRFPIPKRVTDIDRRASELLEGEK